MSELVKWVLMWALARVASMYSCQLPGEDQAGATDAVSNFGISIQSEQCEQQQQKVSNGLSLQI